MAPSESDNEKNQTSLKNTVVERTSHPACRNELVPLHQPANPQNGHKWLLHPRASAQHYGFLLYAPRHEKVEKHCPGGNLLGSGRVRLSAVRPFSFISLPTPQPCSTRLCSGIFLTCSSTAWPACLSKATWKGFIELRFSGLVASTFPH